jgi:hypothetical protein
MTAFLRLAFTCFAFFLLWCRDRFRLPIGVMGGIPIPPGIPKPPDASPGFAPARSNGKPMPSGTETVLGIPRSLPASLTIEP